MNGPQGFFSKEKIVLEKSRGAKKKQYRKDKAKKKK